jgi:site-specific DNA recombinase
MILIYFGGFAMRAAAYARFSSDMQREESIEAQLMDIRKYAEKNNIFIVKEYIDEAISGQTDLRDAFQQMISDAKKKIFDVVLVHKVDRFARNRYDAAIYKSALRKYGIRVIYVMQPIDDSPEGGLLEGILESFAEYYSRNLAQEVMKGLKQNALKARFNGGYAPLGYDIVDKRYVVNEKEARIVREIFKLCLDGYGYKKIAEILNQKGYRNKFGKPFVFNSIPGILMNEKYAGIYAFNKTQRKYHEGKRNMKRYKPKDEVIFVEDGVPAIISKEVFDMVQREIKRRAPMRGKSLSVRDYLLSGLVFCECGYKMAGYSQKNAKDGARYFYYRCSKCQNSIRAEVIEEQVTKMVKEQIFSNIDSIIEKVSEYISRQESNRPHELTYLKNELKNNQQQISNIVNMIANGVASIQLGKKLQELELYVEGIKERINELQQTSSVSKEALRKWLMELKCNFDKGEGIKNILPIFINRIVVSKDNIEVSFIIKDCANWNGAEGGSRTRSSK